MKRISLLVFLILSLYGAGFAQLIVDKGIYKANFSNTYRAPRYVSYTLYKGGGDCNRDQFSFTNDDPRLQCATAADYRGSGYEKGHMANAEDFAFDCAKDELTFRYYNCLPQTANLNKGVWKTNETLIRKWSQTQKLYIVCGGFFSNKRMGDIAVPSYCWKIVQSVSSGKILFCGWFSNTSHAKLEEISLAELEKRLNSKIVLFK